MSDKKLGSGKRSSQASARQRCIDIRKRRSVIRETPIPGQCKAEVHNNPMNCCEIGMSMVNGTLIKFLNHELAVKALSISGTLSWYRWIVAFFAKSHSLEKGDSSVVFR